MKTTWTILGLGLILTIGSSEVPSGSGPREPRQAYYRDEGEILVENTGSHFGTVPDLKSVEQIQRDLENLADARSSLQTLIIKMSGVLNHKANARSANIVHYTPGGVYYGVDTLVKIYNHDYGFVGYPYPLGIPCATVPVVKTLPTIPVLIKRITADTTYLVDLYNRAIVGHVPVPVVGTTYTYFHH